MKASTRIGSSEIRVRNDLPSAMFRPAARRMAKRELRRARRNACRSFIEEGLEELDDLRGDAPLFCEGHHSEAIDVELEPVAALVDDEECFLVGAAPRPRLHHGLRAFMGN